MPKKLVPAVEYKEFRVLAVGLLDLVCCTGLSVAETTARVRSEVLCGTSGGWRRRLGKGTAVRCPDFPKNRHVLYVC